jgi:RNase P subunit RPR2
MVVEVIGKDTTVIKETVCNNCASILRYTNSDTRMKKYTDYGGMTEAYKVITCPCCCKEIEVR